MGVNVTIYEEPRIADQKNSSVSIADVKPDGTIIAMPSKNRIQRALDRFRSRGS